MQDGKQQNGEAQAPAGEAKGFTVPEGDLFLFVRVSPTKGEMQVLFADPMTALGLVAVAEEFLRSDLRRSFNQSQAPAVQLPPGLDIGSITRLARNKVRQG
jgi:hypothetical protein